MGLLQRIRDLLKSNISDLISKAEDPEKLLTSAIDDMQNQLLEAKRRVAASIADKTRLAKQLESMQAKTEDWEKQAMAAVRAGRDDLAMEALAKKKEHEATALQLEQQLAGQKAAVDELKKALTALTAKLDETKRKKTILVARAKRAEAQKHIAETLSVAGDRSALEKIERMEEKVEQIEAEAEAHWEIAALAGSHDRSLEEQIKQLEAHAVDDDLALLKDKMREMGMLAPPGARAALSSGGAENHARPAAGAAANEAPPAEGAPQANGGGRPRDAAERADVSEAKPVPAAAQASEKP